MQDFILHACAAVYTIWYKVANQVRTLSLVQRPQMWLHAKAPCTRSQWVLMGGCTWVFNTGDAYVDAVVGDFDG